jgi:hypothetical protein
VKSRTCVSKIHLVKANVRPCYNGGFVIEFIFSMLAVIRMFFRSRSDTALEILALRQQVAVLKRKRLDRL